VPIFVPATTERTGNIRPQSSVQTDAIELNWHGLVFDKLTNGQVEQTYLLFVDAYVSVFM